MDAGEIGAGHRVTALYEMVLAGGQIPQGASAPTLDDGEPVEGTREIAADDLVLVKVRYKAVEASEQDPAKEVSARLTQDALTVGVQGLAPDLRWAVAIGALAEILKGSPYGDKSLLPEIEAIVTAQRERDADRREFVSLFERVKPLLSP